MGARIPPVVSRCHQSVGSKTATRGVTGEKARATRESAPHKTSPQTVLVPWSVPHQESRKDGAQRFSLLAPHSLPSHRSRTVLDAAKIH